MSYYRFIDRPAYIPRQMYQEAIDGVIRRNKELPGLKSVYKFGNITSPGISDLDLLFVFRNETISTASGFESLPEEHKSLFTHGIMAISEKHFIENNHFTLWSGHELMWGEACSETRDGKRTTDESEQLGIQTALEFLIANYIDLKIQKCYRVIKLRAFLQHMKGLLYDLELLNDRECMISSSLHDFKNRIVNWFDKTPTDDEITEWINKFEPLYVNYVEAILKKHALYLPENSRYPIAKNMMLLPGGKLAYTRKGLLLPVAFSALGRNYFKLQHRLNTFSFMCPITHSAAAIVKERYQFLSKMKAYNREHLPNFMTITTSITAKLI